MHVVIDMNRRDGNAEVLRSLGLPASTAVTRLSSRAPFCGLGGTERAVFYTNLESGGMKYQLELLKKNDGVGEWIVVSPGTDPATLSEVLTILKPVSRVMMYASAKDAAAALKEDHPAVQARSCLVISLSPEADAEGLRNILSDLRPGWTFETAGLSPADKKALAFSRVILTGREPGDFARLALPEGLTPILVMNGMEERPGFARGKLRSRICSLAGLGWSDMTMDRQIYLISTAYERLRMEYEGKSPCALRSSEDFVMWDAFGLPSPEDSYTEGNLSEFLSRFDGCQSLARIHLPR